MNKYPYLLLGILAGLILGVSIMRMVKPEIKADRCVCVSAIDE